VSTLRASVGLFGLVICVLLIIPAQLIMIPIGGKGAEIAPKLFFSVLRRLFGIQIDVRGLPTGQSPTLYVSNHVSWLDIFVLGSVVRGSFVARGDLEGWPIFGWLSTLQQTVFVDRTSRVRSGQQLDQLSERLLADDNLILFPEGTSSDGTGVLPFKSSLFAVVERWKGAQPLTVQPLSLTYTEVNNMPLTRHYRPYIGWYGDMDLPPHFWGLLKLGRIKAVIEFHEPISSAEMGSRKAMSKQCQKMIAASVERQNAHYDSAEAA
jgi:lyso-ornithine lipid O-acyltransferase